MDKEILTFEYERETKNMVRYQEVAEVDPPCIGTLYVSKAALGANPPKHLTVTIEAGAE